MSGGVQPPGHLWKVGKRIEAKCKVKLPGEAFTLGGLDGHQRYRLKQFAYELGTGIHGRRYEALGGDLLRYLDKEMRSQDTFEEQDIYWMANEVFT